MLNVTGAGDSRCLNCKSQKCFVCEHRKTSQELINQGLKDDNKHDFDEDSQNPLFIVSNNITSNFNDSRCLYCRSQHCFQVSIPSILKWPFFFNKLNFYFYQELLCHYFNNFTKKLIY